MALTITTVRVEKLGIVTKFSDRHVKNVKGKNATRSFKESRLAKESERYPDLVT